MRAFPHHELLTHPFEMGMMVLGVSERGLRVSVRQPRAGPWVQSRGLGEVVRDLPLALAWTGIDVRMLVPGTRR